MASSSRTSEEPPSSSIEAVSMEASGNQTSTTNRPAPRPLMDLGLLAVACSGSWKKLQSFLSGNPHQPSSDGDDIQQPSRDEEAVLRVSLLDGVTVEGDTFLHVMATNSVGEDLVEDGLGLISSKAVQLLFVRNKQGDTALHCAARAEKSQMVSFLLNLARGNDADTVKALLETENNSRWTVLHEAIRVGNNEMVDFLMTEDPQLASFPKDGTSPMYLAILLKRKTIAQTLYNKTDVDLSYSGPNGQNALHAAVLRHKDLTKMLLGWNNNTLTVQQDENGSTPLHLAASERYQRDRGPIRLFLLEANPNALYQPDNKGSFPIHVAATVDANAAVSDYIKNSPHCACLRDAKGRTFLHVAVEKEQFGVVYFTCRNQSLSWILNMQDNDGNTALHLAVQAESLAVFCALLANRHVQLNITNGKGETPLDIARHRVKGNLNLNQSSEVKIHNALKVAKAESGICRQDYFQENNIIQKGLDEKLEVEKMKDSTQNLSIVSVLIATVTFGATFAMPGGYRADDHTNGGTPTLAGRYVFDAFTMANTLAFTLSATATIGLMCSGSPLYNTRIRLMHFYAAFYCMSIAIKCLVAAFAIGAYTMLAQVAHRTGVAICVLSSLVLLYENLEIIIKIILMIAPYCVRRGKIYTFIWFMGVIMGNIIVEYWPIIVIFCSTLRSHTGKVESAIQPPTPSP